MAQVLSANREPRLSFEQKLFDAALSECERQIADKFEMLSHMQSPYSRAFVNFMATMAPERQFVCARALIKKQLAALDPQLPELVSEALSKEDERIFSAYKSQILSATDFVQLAKDARELQQSERVVGRTIMNAMEAAIFDLWPEASRVEEGPSEVIYQHNEGGWVLETALIATPATAGISYYHVIRDREQNLLRPPISYFSWLGLCGTSTEWVNLRKEDVELASLYLSEMFGILGKTILAALRGAPVGRREKGEGPYLNL